MRKIFFVVIIIAFSFLITGFQSNKSTLQNEIKEEGNALKSFEWWYAQRAYPDEFIPAKAYKRAFEYYNLSLKKTRKKLPLDSSWRSIGPTNIGGRVLALAVDPSNPNIVWAGSASGGLWKSTSGGEGTNAWTFINTGYPTLCVSALAIDPNNPATMYMGTGEISLYQRPLVGTPGARASYGMGILKSTDGGEVWNQTSLSWEFSDITAVQRIVVNPHNTRTLYAATSEGTYKSTDAGDTWSLSHSVLMAMDVVINPSDTTILYVACGNGNSSPNPGLYKSTDAGSTWTKLTAGLPSSNLGRTALSISPSNPNIVYAGITNASTFGIIGLYKTTDNGANWTSVSSFNYVGTQGWYNNVVVVHPLNPDTVYCNGLYIARTTNGGPNLSYISSSVHADHHAFVFDRTNPSISFFGTDGGVYKTLNACTSFIDCNDGFVTTQFYPGFANSLYDSTIALGGLQDNGVLKYTGSTSWLKVDGGDGGWCAIDPTNHDLMYDEYIYLTISKSTNGGITFLSANSGLPSNSSNANFIAPFVMSPSNPNILYAGAKNVFKTTNGAASWFAPNGGANLNGTKIACIGVSFTSPDTLLAATGSGALGDNPLFQVFRSTNGGQSWSNVTGSLPNRYPTDIEFDPTNSKNVYLTYSGYGTGHVFKSTDAGMSWTNISGNLPDIPHQSVTLDPDEPTQLYVGTDLGIFRTTDNDSTWEDFNDGISLAMVLDLTISRANHALRASTFGNGVYERWLPRTPQLSLLSPNGGETFVDGQPVTIQWEQKYIPFIDIEFSNDNGSTWATIVTNFDASEEKYVWIVPTLTTTEGLIRIFDSQTQSLVDISNTTFSIFVSPELLNGWNLISVHLTAPDMRKNTLFPTAISEAYAYDAGYAAKETLQVGIGYWLKFAEPQNVKYAGDVIAAETVSVKRGWNMIGTISSPVVVSSIVQIPSEIVTTPYYGYRFGYITADTLLPKHGYWVKVNQDGRLVIH
jgi:photosystem II stability/assembly factor-like uncharacterized protein